MRQEELREEKEERVGRGDGREETKEECWWRKLESGERGGGRRKFKIKRSREERGEEEKIKLILFSLLQKGEEEETSLILFSLLLPQIIYSIDLLVSNHILASLRTNVL